MKKIFILFCMLYSIHAQAQTLKEYVDKLIPQEKVPTGILYNRVLSVAGIEQFGQNDKIDTSSYHHFKQAYFELYNATYDNSKMPTMKDLQDLEFLGKEKNTLSLGVISYDFNYSQELANIMQESGTIAPNSQLKISNLSTFIVAPFTEKPLKVGQSIQIGLNENLIFNNTSTKLISLKANFGNGKSTVFEKNTQYKLQYHEIGQNLLTYYSELWVQQSENLSKLSAYGVVDAYFSKFNFIDPIYTQTPMHIISRLRDDAVLQYLYTGLPTGKQGRPRQFDGKVDIKKPDLNYFSCVHQDAELCIYEAIVFAKALKRKIN